MSLNPVIGVLMRREKFGDTGTHKKEGHVKPETEIGARQPQTKEHQDCWKAPEARRGKEGFFLEPLEGTWPWQHFDFGFLTSRIMRK